MKFFSAIRSFFTTAVFFIFIFPAHAAVQLTNPLNTFDEGGTGAVREIVGLVIGRLVLPMVGSIALLMFVIGGYFWLTAAGNSDKIKAGKDIMVYTALGLLIIFGAYTAIAFIFGVLPLATPATPSP